MKSTFYMTMSLFALATALPAAAAAAPTSQKYQFRGENAYASFSSLDATGCIATDVSIWAGESVTKEGPGAPASRTEVFAYMSKIDICNDWTPLISASGMTSVADLDIDRTRAASLEATIPLVDYISGTTTDLDVSLTWAGVGEEFRGHSSGHDSYPGGMVHYRSNGSYRDATVSGTVSLDVDPGTNLLANASSYAQLSASRSGFMQITKR